MNRPDFWHERWQRGAIGFHRSDVHPLLARHWPDVAGDAPASVLVPLAGKSLDLHWLAGRGHQVVGVELDAIAVRSFFDEAGLHPDIDEQGALSRWRAGGITLWHGDFFDYRARPGFELFYDRAALIALPEADRPRYLEHLAAQLARGASGLLITLEYPQECMDGPPYSVPESELADCEAFEFEPLARIDALDEHPRFAERGLPWLYECVYRLSLVDDRPVDR
jgi:thiopurine S-methyltransferase